MVTYRVHLDVKVNPKSEWTLTGVASSPIERISLKDCLGFSLTDRALTAETHGARFLPKENRTRALSGESMTHVEYFATLDYWNLVLLSDWVWFYTRFTYIRINERLVNGTTKLSKLQALVRNFWPSLSLKAISAYHGIVCHRGPSGVFKTIFFSE